MILAALIAVPLLGGFVAWLTGRKSERGARIISLVALGIDFGIVISLWARHGGELALRPGAAWVEEFQASWIPRFGIGFHLALDGLSLLLVALTVFLGILSVLVSWKEIRERVGFFHFNLLWVLAGILGVFLALDLFLFYFFWELMLIPMYFLIGIWGHERRVYASTKFFLFTQAGGLLMLVSILALYVIHGRATGVYSFDLSVLLGTPLSSGAAWLIMLGFLAAFLVKLPAVPIHSWLPDAHTEAPTAGSVVLAGLLLKTGAYGLLRFVLPLFPDAAHRFAPIGMALGVAGIIYGAHLAFAQRDFKRLVAYTSISHMGYVLLAVFALNTLALQGAVLQIICHALSTGGLFILAGVLQERIHTRDLEVMGGLWEKVPRLGGAGMFLVLASLGLPGLGNFVAEFLVLAGTYQRNALIAILASLGFIVAMVYSLKIIQKVFHGPKEREWEIRDIGAREVLVFALIAVLLLWLGLYPQLFLDTAGGTLDRIASELAPGNVAPAASVTALPAWIGNPEGGSR